MFLMPLHTRILIGLVVGVALGLFIRSIFPAAVDPANPSGGVVAPQVDKLATTVIEPLGRIFLRLVLMVVLPLVFSALVLGVVGLGDISRLGRVGVISLLFTVLLSGCAVAIGLTLVNFIRPGNGLTDSQREQLQASYSQGAADAVEKANAAKPLHRILLDMLPENPLQEMVGALDGSSKGNGMLAVMCFALTFGIALSLVESNRRQALVNVLEALFDVCMVIIDFAMRLAPFGVACLMFAITVRLGVGILATLAWFVATVLLGLAIQLFVIYPLAIWVFARRNPLEFFRQASAAMLTAFGTSSSNATLPTAIRVAEENLKLSPEISRFVLTVGSTANQNGTALYEGVVVLFLAQVFGVELTLPQQLTVILMSVLAGVGTAGVPGGSIPMIVVVLKSIGVPGDGIAIILGVDRLLDMCRTVLNVTGDLALAACVSAKITPAPVISSSASE
jgi:dicarboxylate/amino acid:cation (Na+ or H+) symporter, DAACS family